MVSGVVFSSLSDDWRTPSEFFGGLDREFHFRDDPCPVGGSGGLSRDWLSPVFVNPPYSEVGLWVAKAVGEFLKGKTVVLLVASRTDTRWFHDFVLKYASEIRFVRGRLKFSGYDNSAPFPSCVVVFKP